MEKEELEKLVPIIEQEDMDVVRLIDIPNPYRTEFYIDSSGSTHPLLQGEGICHYSCDWYKWLSIRFNKKIKYSHRFQEDMYIQELTDYMCSEEYLEEMLNR